MLQAKITKADFGVYGLGRKQDGFDLYCVRLNPEGNAWFTGTYEQCWDWIDHY